MRAVILAGGRGTRLKPFTCNQPRCLVSLVNKPFLIYQLELLKAHDISEIILCAGDMCAEVERLFGDGRALGVNISYLDEPEPLGTAGAVKAALKGAVSAATLVINGDVLTNINLTGMIEKHCSLRSTATVAIREVDDPAEFGQIEIDSAGRVLSYLERPSLEEIRSNIVNAGIYILEPSALELIPNNKPYSFERGLFPAMAVDKLPFFSFKHIGYWNQIGNIESYYRCSHDILQGKIQTAMIGTEQGDNIWIGEDFEFEAPLEVTGPMIIGRNVHLGENVTLSEFTVLGDNVTLGNGARVEGSVIMSNTTIEAGAVLNRAIIGENSIIGEGSIITGGRVPAAIGQNSKIGSYTRI